MGWKRERDGNVEDVKKKKSGCKRHRVFKSRQLIFPVLK